MRSQNQGPSSIHSLHPRLINIRSRHLTRPRHPHIIRRRRPRTTLIPAREQIIVPSFLEEEPCFLGSSVPARDELGSSGARADFACGWVEGEELDSGGPGAEDEVPGGWGVDEEVGVDGVVG